MSKSNDWDEFRKTTLEENKKSANTLDTITAMRDEIIRKYGLIVKQVSRGSYSFSTNRAHVSIVVASTDKEKLVKVFYHGEIGVISDSPVIPVTGWIRYDRIHPVSEGVKVFVDLAKRIRERGEKE